MMIARSNQDLHAALQGKRGSFVPTMGALHEGHLALVRRAVSLGGPVVVSIFVNPTQFGPGEDYSRYPRTFDADVELASKAGAQIIFAPAVEEMYPSAVHVEVPTLPAVATRPGLEDAHRPGHFAGVCQVVARLFDLVQPRHAVFGEKDFQQLLAITALVRQEADRWPGLKIVPHATVRENDGLAMSSRNRYLKPDQRDRALALWRALQSANDVGRASGNDVAAMQAAMRETLLDAQLKIDYAMVRDADTLEPVRNANQPMRAVIAARVDNVRLIDNAAVGALS